MSSARAGDWIRSNPSKAMQTASSGWSSNHCSTSLASIADKAASISFTVWVIATLDKSLGDLMPALHEKRLRGVHEGEFQLAFRPSRIGEVGVDTKYFHLVRRVKGAKAYPRGGGCAEASAP